MDSCQNISSLRGRHLPGTLLSPQPTTEPGMAGAGAPASGPVDCLLLILTPGDRSHFSFHAQICEDIQALEREAVRRKVVSPSFFPAPWVLTLPFRLSVSGRVVSNNWLEGTVSFLVNIWFNFWPLKRTDFLAPYPLTLLSACSSWSDFIVQDAHFAPAPADFVDFPRSFEFGSICFLGMKGFRKRQEGKRRAEGMIENNTVILTTCYLFLSFIFQKVVIRSWVLMDPGSVYAEGILQQQCSGGRTWIAERRGPWASSCLHNSSPRVYCLPSK